MNDALGQDLLLLDGFKPLFPQTSGAALVAAALYRRWTTDPASPAGKALYKSACRDLRALLGAQIDPARLVSLTREYQQVAREDERVQDVVCTFELAEEGRKLVFRAMVQCKAGPFTLVVPFDSFIPELRLGQ